MTELLTQEIICTHAVILGHSQVGTIWTWGFGFTHYNVWDLV